MKLRLLKRTHFQNAKEQEGYISYRQLLQLQKMRLKGLRDLRQLLFILQKLLLKEGHLMALIQKTWLLE